LKEVSAYERGFCYEGIAGGDEEKCPLVVGKAASWGTEIILEQEALG
jgi:hypothetical protein